MDSLDFLNELLEKALLKIKTGEIDLYEDVKFFKDSHIEKLAELLEEATANMKKGELDLRPAIYLVNSRGWGELLFLANVS